MKEKLSEHDFTKKFKAELGQIQAIACKIE
jgi:hypothetical protein